MNSKRIYNVLNSQDFAHWYENEFIPATQNGNGFSSKIKREIESFFDDKEVAKALTREELARLTVPTQGKFVRFGPVSQVCVMAAPLNAEARTYQNEIADECKEMADRLHLQVVYVEEHFHGGSKRIAFLPANE
jgi:hypothetical protein